MQTIGKDDSGPRFRWNKVPGEDEVKFRNLLTLIRPAEFSTPLSVLQLFKSAGIYKDNSSTIIVRESCTSGVPVYCMDATATFPPGSDKARYNCKGGR